MTRSSPGKRRSDPLSCRDGTTCMRPLMDAGEREEGELEKEHSPDFVLVLLDAHGRPYLVLESSDHDGSVGMEQ